MIKKTFTIGSSWEPTHKNTPWARAFDASTEKLIISFPRLMSLMSEDRIARSLQNSFEQLTGHPLRISEFEFGEVVPRHARATIEFENEIDVTMFILKWGVK